MEDIEVYIKTVNANRRGAFPCPASRVAWPIHDPVKTRYEQGDGGYKCVKRNGEGKQ